MNVSELVLLAYTEKNPWINTGIKKIKLRNGKKRPVIIKTLFCD